MKRPLVLVAAAALVLSGCGSTSTQPAKPARPKVKASSMDETFKLGGGGSARWAKVEGQSCLYVDSDLNDGSHAGMVTCSEKFDPTGKPSFKVLTDWRSMRDAKIRRVQVGGVDCIEAKSDNNTGGTVRSVSC